MMRICKSFIGIVLGTAAMLFMVPIGSAADISTGNARKAVKELFLNFPAKLVEAQLVGDPVLDRDRKKSNDKVNLIQTLHLRVKPEAYKSFADNFMAILDKIAKNKVQGKGFVDRKRWDEYKFGVCVYQYAGISNFKANDVCYTYYEIDSEAIFERLYSDTFRGMGCELTVLFNDDSMFPQKHVFTMHSAGGIFRPFLERAYIYVRTPDSKSHSGKPSKLADIECESVDNKFILYPCFYFDFEDNRRRHSWQKNVEYEQKLAFTVFKRDLPKVTKLDVGITPAPYWTARQQSDILWGK